MLIRGISIILFIILPMILCQDSENNVEKRRIGHRLPNFLRFQGAEPADIQKRRIGLRLPNMLKFKEAGMYPQMEKRRMGMRLPNIIFLRNEKKNVLEY